MCTIDKLLIKGIRSFSPDNQNVIEFYRPLTLIVGQNGAGKTTIIECLKQACTGELPPNTRSGQSFVHDPKVAGETEVKALIKLRFRTVDGAPVVVLRSFQLTQKKTALQFKALDQTLQMLNRTTGEKVANNHRCQELDKIVPSLMGVSKAILENVVFVHQEDSNWPLADGQTLKKKFDDIFAATKYTKALEALRKLRTEKVQEAKELKLRLEHTGTHMNSAAKLREQAAEGDKRDREITAEMATLAEQIQGHKQAASEADNKLGQMSDLMMEESTLVTQLKEISKKLGEREVELREEATDEDMECTLEELQTLRNEQEPQLRAAEQDKLRLEQSLAEARAGLESLKERYERTLTMRGRLSAEAEAHERATQDRDRIAREAAATLNLPRMPQQGNLTDDQLARFEAAFVEGLNAAEERLKGVRAANRAQDDEQGRAVEAAARAVAAAREAGIAKQAELQRSEQRLAALQNELGLCAVGSEVLEDAAGHAAASQAEAAAKQEQYEGQRFKEKLDDLAGRLADMQRRAANLRQERDRLTTAGESRTRIKLKQQELRGKDAQIASLISTRRVKLEGLLACNAGGLPPAGQLKAAVQGALKQKQETLGLRSGELREARDRASALEGQLHAVRTQRQALVVQAEALRAEIDRGMATALGEAQPAERLQQSVEECEKKKDESQSTAARLSSLALSYDMYRKRALSHHQCMTCGRPFHSAEEQAAFIAKQENEEKAIPDRMNELTSSISALEEKLGRLKILQPKQFRLDALEGTELRAVTDRVRIMEVQVGQQDAAVQRLQADVAAAEQELQEAQRLSQEVGWEVDRLVGEAGAIRAELDTLGLDSQTLGADAGRDVFSVDADLEALEGERGSLEREREGLLRKQERLREEVQAARALHQHAREGLLKAQAQADKARALGEQIEGLQRDIAQLMAEIRSATEGIPGLEARQERLLTHRESRREAARTDERGAEESLRRWREYSVELQRRARELNEYRTSGKADKLTKAVGELQNIQQKQDSLEQKSRGQQAELAEKIRQIKEHADSRRIMDSLINFKRSKVEQEAKFVRIEQIKKLIAEIGNRELLGREIQRLEHTIQQLQSRQDQLRGSLGTIRDQVRAAKKELQMPNYRDIDERYRKQLICLKTTEMAHSDVEKYHKALEKALLAFHTTKMSDINKIIKELWQKTYRNQDIDYIQIKADADGARSYNYRVVMISGGAELDMRGRCSAGQKVLACLIIRLALAETFCLNCGILALDEPTTNLDQANSASLADALRQIMEQRRGQANFQLVVITHDEQFAHLIGTREHAEFMWRVTKDANQHSLVTQEDISG